jgi:hypothetical protein
MEWWYIHEGRSAHAPFGTLITMGMKKAKGRGWVIGSRYLEVPWI